MVYGPGMEGLRISELAHRAGISTSTVRYYERIGLVPVPDRTPSGYRAYDPEAEARLLFITRGKRMGLSLEHVAELMAIWDGTNCGPTKSRLASLLNDKRAEIADQIRELRSFDAQLAEVRASIAASPTSDVCDPDLACCAPELREADDALGSACTLAAGERPGREAAFSSLFAHVVSWARTTRSLQLRFAPTADIAQQVETLTAQESACCAFLTFATRCDNDHLVWEITAPSDEADVVINALAALLPAGSGGSS
jgi:DNA-binding transcriptional MerR regulator